MLVGVVMIGDSKVNVTYRFINDDTIECFTKNNMRFETHYKSLIVEDK